MERRKRILFVRLGHFSHTNDRVAEQLVRNFPDHELTAIDVKSYARRDKLMAARTILSEVATFGPTVLRSRGDLHAFFFRTPAMFRHINQSLIRETASFANELDFVVQTQGIFSGRIPGVPLLIYTDYTTRDNLGIPGHDKRLFRSDDFLRYERALYQGAEAVATSGSHVERTLIEQYSCDPSRVRTVHIGANVAIVPVSTELSRYAAKRIVFVGVEWERKGGPELVAAFRTVLKTHPDARLTIVGCSPAVSHPNIDVVGRVPPADMPRFFKDASVFCLPSRIEPLGIAAIEASLYRLPVVATQIDGFRETVTDGESGILVPPESFAAIATALGRLFDDPALSQRMGAAGFARNRTRFDWDEVGKRLASMANGIIGRTR